MSLVLVDQMQCIDDIIGCFLVAYCQVHFMCAFLTRNAFSCFSSASKFEERNISNKEGLPAIFMWSM